MGRFHEKLKTISNLKNNSEYVNFKSTESMDTLPFMISIEKKKHTSSLLPKKIVSL
jgi:hypothetical protein